MKSDRRNYVVVGGFVLAMAAALTVWITLLTGRTGPTDDYSVVYANVNGLKAGTRILYEGFPVGLIEAIDPVERDGQRVFRIDVSIQRGWPIPEDSVAIIATGLFSAAVLDVQAGESSTLLQPGSQIPSEEAADVFAAVNAAADRLTRVLDDFAESSPRMLADAERFAGEINVAIDQINELLGTSNVERIGRILENIEGGTSDVSRLVSELRETGEDVGALIARTEDLLESEGGDVTEAIEDLNHSLAAVARHIDAITSNLEATTRNLSEFSRQIRENPGVLIRGRETDGGT